MKIIFLDIDGVLNRLDGGALATPCADGMRIPWVVDLGIVSNLETFLRQAEGVRVVVTSTWRYDVSNLSDFSRLVRISPHFFHADWRTARTKENRKHDVDTWLSTHPDVTHFTVVDDGHAEWFSGMPFVQVDAAKGLTDMDLISVSGHLEI